MSADVVPMDRVQAGPVVPVTTTSPPHAPVTPEEAAAIARRIRVEARLPRVAVIGTALGVVCGAAAVLPFLDSRGYMAGVLGAGNGFGVVAFLPGWLLAGLLPLLAFYAGRLHFQAGRSSTGEIEAGLRTVRRTILWSMFASAMAFVGVLATESHHRDPYGDVSWVALLYAGCFLGCVAIIGDVRRGLGDFDSEHQRRRRRLARGFAVQLGPANPPVQPISVTASPDEVPPASAAIPVARVAPVDAMAAAATEDEHFKDLRLLMTLAVLVAIALHAVRLGETLPSGPNVAEYLAGAMEALFTGVTVRPVAGNELAGATFLLALLAVLTLIPCGVLWIVWGILALNYGPAFRRGVAWLTIVTLALAAAVSLPAWLYGRAAVDNRFAGHLARAPEIIHGLFLGLLLTRPGVRRMFSRGSDADEG